MINNEKFVSLKKYKGFFLLKSKSGFLFQKLRKKNASEISWPFKTVTDDTGKGHFTIAVAAFFPHNPNQLYLSENGIDIRYEILRLNFAALRKNPFSLEELAKVKMATSGVNFEDETFSFIPTKIKIALKKYQDVNTTFTSCLAEFCE